MSTHAGMSLVAGVVVEGSAGPWLPGMVRSRGLERAGSSNAEKAPMNGCVD